MVLATDLQVYGVNVLVSSGDGKVREQDLRTTVFKRNANKNYQLKMKASRWVAAPGFTPFFVLIHVFIVKYLSAEVIGCLSEVCI